MKPLPPLFLAALLLAARNATAQPPPIDASAAGSLMVAQQDTPLPEGGSCSGDIARYRAIQTGKSMCSLKLRQAWTRKPRRPKAPSHSAAV